MSINILLGYIPNFLLELTVNQFNIRAITFGLI